MTPHAFVAMALLAVAFGGPAGATLVECEGRCEDAAGNVTLVQNRCDDVAERCVAGCDEAGERPMPYAECEATGRVVVPRPPLESPDGVRFRDGD